jgi:hypothetical protein
LTLASVVIAVASSCTKMSVAPLVSPGTRLVESPLNDTMRPSAEMIG